MKRLIFYIILFFTCVIILCSCSQGRWVGGNAKNFQQRHNLKLKKQHEKAKKNTKM